MYYLISNENSEYQIIDDEIIKKSQVWSCSLLVKNIKNVDGKLYYEAVDGTLIHAGTIVKMSINKTKLVAKGLKLKYKNNWYTIKTLEGEEGIFIALLKPYDTGYIQVFTKIDMLDEIQDVKC